MNRLVILNPFYGRHHYLIDRYKFLSHKISRLNGLSKLCTKIDTYRILFTYIVTGNSGKAGHAYTFGATDVTLFSLESNIANASACVGLFVFITFSFKRNCILFYSVIYIVSVNRFLLVMS